MRSKTINARRLDDLREDNLGVSVRLEDVQNFADGFEVVDAST